MHWRLVITDEGECDIKYEKVKQLNYTYIHLKIKL